MVLIIFPVINYLVFVFWEKQGKILVDVQDLWVAIQPINVRKE